MAIIDKLEHKKEDNTISLATQKPQITTFTNPKTIRTLSFTNRLNEAYEVNDIPLEEFEIGEVEGYQSYIERGLNPNNQDNLIYGYAKQFKPLTQRLCDMRGSLQAANEQLAQHLDQQQQEQLKEVEQAAPTSPPPTEANND